MNAEVTPPQRLVRPPRPAHKKAKLLALARRRRRIRRRRMLVMLTISAIAVLAFLWAEKQRRDTAARLEETQKQLEQINSSTEKQATVDAKNVLERVSRLFDLPSDPPPTVATIVNIEQLRATSDFYNKAKDGDQLIITKNRAILYDPERDIILDAVSIDIRAQTSNEKPPPLPADVPAPAPSSEIPPTGETVPPPAGANQDAAASASATPEPLPPS